MTSPRQAQFLGFMCFEGQVCILFYADTHDQFHDLYRRKELSHERCVVLSPNPLLTTADLYDTFPASRERNAGILARAEFLYTDAISELCSSVTGRDPCAIEGELGGPEAPEAGRRVGAKRRFRER